MAGIASTGTSGTISTFIRSLFTKSAIRHPQLEPLSRAEFENQRTLARAR
jgi:hypothetical protein